MVCHRGLNIWDIVRALIPPFAFVGWTMLQKVTAFEAVAPNFASDWRWALGIALGIILGLIAGVLGEKVNKEPTKA